MGRISNRKRSVVSLALVGVIAFAPGCSVCRSAYSYSRDHCPSFDEFGAFCIGVGVFALGWFAGGGGGHGHYHSGYHSGGYHGYSNHCW